MMKKIVFVEKNFEALDKQIAEANGKARTRTLSMLHNLPRFSSTAPSGNAPLALAVGLPTHRCFGGHKKRTHILCALFL